MTTLADDNTPYKLLVEQSSAPSTPAAGKQVVYLRTSDHKLVRKDSSGTITLMEGGSSSVLTNSNISPTTSNVTAAVNNRYFADVSGLTANRNFVVPAGAVGDIIELNIKVGDNAFALIIIGDTGISIQGGSTATEWSRLFITGETIKLIADTTSNWQVVEDGRIPCLGLMTLSTDDTTNSVDTKTKPTWDNIVHNVGDIGDTGNGRFNVRRAGRYKVSAYYSPSVNLAATNYIAAYIYLNNSAGTLIQEGFLTASNTSNLYGIGLPPRAHTCAAADTLDFYYQSAGNKGAEADSTWFQVEEYLKP
jgi:hypothetical protein